MWGLMDEASISSRQENARAIIHLKQLRLDRNGKALIQNNCIDVIHVVMHMITVLAPYAKRTP